MQSVVKKSWVIVALLLSATLTACATKTPVCLDTPQTVVPHWIDGVMFCSSAMIDKNEYWKQKYRSGKASPEDLIKLIDSNSRFYSGLIGRMEAYKECAALARQELIDAQEDGK